MQIAEIFHSIQGEGELTGVPSVFIRTSGCNLRCSWCDTMYASWNPEGEDMAVDTIVAEVKRHASRHCVLTGGEPMVARGIRELASALREEGLHITIETAGTVAPEGIACDLASISPKLANSTPGPDAIGQAWVERHERTRSRPDVLKAWVQQYPYQLKFVVSSASDLPEIEKVVADIGRTIPAWKILLMPEGIGENVIRGHQGELAGICIEKGYRFCDRLHIRLFGNTRGT